MQVSTSLLKYMQLLYSQRKLRKTHITVYMYGENDRQEMVSCSDPLAYGWLFNPVNYIGTPHKFMLS